MECLAEIPGLVDCLVTLVDFSENHLVQKHVCRALAAVAGHWLLHPYIRALIARGALTAVGDLAVARHTDPELRREAESVLRGLGFQGATDVTDVCNNDTAMLCDWFELNYSIEEQIQTDETLAHCIAALWIPHYDLDEWGLESGGGGGRRGGRRVRVGIKGTWGWRG